MASSFDLPRAVVLCIPRLYGGGAEKVMALMAGWWAARGVHVYLITFRTAPDDFPLHPGVRRILLKDYLVQDAPVIPEWPQESCNIHALRHAFLDILHAEDAIACLPVISFLARMNMRCLLAIQGLPCNIVISERTYPPAVFLGEHEEALRKALYPQADALVVQTSYTKKHWGIPLVGEKKCHSIANPFLPGASPHAAQVPHHCERYFLAIGRLSRSKRHDILLQAFAPLAQTDPSLHLYIAGDGELKHDLLDLRQKLGMQNSVTFLGHVQDVSLWLHHALALVHTSDFEGFPNVLLEALYEGCPVIATDCPAGPAEIIEHGVTGLLVPCGSIRDVRLAMKMIIEKKTSLQQPLFKKAAVKALHRFTPSKILSQWTTLLH